MDLNGRIAQDNFALKDWLDHKSLSLWTAATPRKRRFATAADDFFDREDVILKLAAIDIQIPLLLRQCSKNIKYTVDRALHPLQIRASIMRIHRALQYQLDREDFGRLRSAVMEMIRRHPRGVFRQTWDRRMTETLWPCLQPLFKRLDYPIVKKTDWKFLHPRDPISMAVRDVNTSGPSVPVEQVHDCKLNVALACRRLR